MLCQLPADCLNEIFELLEDKVTLHSCLLVNRLWCKVSVKILWKNIWNFNYFESQIPISLIACLPDESKDLLHRNGIFISTPPPLFNYASFCKILSIYKINVMIKILLKNQQSIVSSSSGNNNNNNNNNNQDLVMQELLKMFMKQISSLKKLIYYSYSEFPNNITFTHFPGARDCLTDLSELNCSSDVHSEFFNQLSQICHNIQSLNIEINNTISNGLKELIYSQNNLKYLSTFSTGDIIPIIPSLMKHSKTLIKLEITRSSSQSVSFITKFTNLQELILSFPYYTFENFSEFQYATFPQLQILKFKYGRPDAKILINFLEVSGKNLKELYIRRCESLNLAIAKFCPNLKSLYTRYMNDEIETLKVIFNSCQQLESFGGSCSKEKEMFEIIAEYSPENFHELILPNYFDTKSILLSQDLESFFISWKNRIPQKSLSLIIANDSNSLVENNENMEIIKKYKKLGIIKKLDIIYII